MGGVLTFGNAPDAPCVAVTMRDISCAMVNFDPDSATPAPEVMKAVVRMNQNHAGVYGTVTRVGQLAVGQSIFLAPPTEKAPVRDRYTIPRRAARRGA